MMLKLHTLGDPAKSDIIIFSPDGPQPFAIEPQEFPLGLSIIEPALGYRWRWDHDLILASLQIERASLLADEGSYEKSQ